tara:strand:- start:946 stop:1440 length:495 start_codon:yes stop_codon:yes gene_type:complete
MKLQNMKLFFWVILVQVFVLNNIQLHGYINPYYYIIFIISLPARNSKIKTLLSSFFLGFIIDIFSNSYGLHSFSCVLLAYIKIIWVFKLDYNKDSTEVLEVKNLNIQDFIITSYSLILIHHLTLFSLDFFSFSDIIPILVSTLFSSIFTLTLLIIHKIFSLKKI